MAVSYDIDEVGHPVPPCTLKASTLRPN